MSADDRACDDEIASLRASILRGEERYVVLETKHRLLNDRVKELERQVDCLLSFCGLNQADDDDDDAPRKSLPLSPFPKNILSIDGNALEKTQSSPVGLTSTISSSATTKKSSEHHTSLFIMVRLVSSDGMLKTVALPLDKPVGTLYPKIYDLYNRVGTDAANRLWSLRLFYPERQDVSYLQENCASVNVGYWLDDTRDLRSYSFDDRVLLIAKVQYHKFKGSPNIWLYSNLEELVRLIKNNLFLRDKTWKKKRYRNVFTGKELVTLLVDTFSMPNRSVAMTICDLLKSSNVIFNAAVQDGPFLDKSIPFRLDEDVVNGILGEAERKPRFQLGHKCLSSEELRPTPQNQLMLAGGTIAPNGSIVDPNHSSPIMLMTQSSEISGMESSTCTTRAFPTSGRRRSSTMGGSARKHKRRSLKMLSSFTTADSIRSTLPADSVHPLDVGAKVEMVGWLGFSSTTPSGKLAQSYVVLSGDYLTGFATDNTDDLDGVFFQINVTLCSAKILDDSSKSSKRRNHPFIVVSPSSGTITFFSESSDGRQAWTKAIQKSQAKRIRKRLSFGLDSDLVNDSLDGDMSALRSSRASLREMLAQECNKTCADCRAENPEWLSLNLGVFICIECSGIHRKLGTHISKVRSASMDVLSEAELEHMRCIGNIVANEYFEANIPDEFHARPNVTSGSLEREQYIRAKYEYKAYVSSKRKFPPTGAAAACVD